MTYTVIFHLSDEESEVTKVRLKNRAIYTCSVIFLSHGVIPNLQRSVLLRTCEKQLRFVEYSNGHLFHSIISPGQNVGIIVFEKVIKTTC